MKYLDKILLVTTKIKTPLSIAGLVIIFLYLVAKQILSLKIFSELGQKNSFIILSDILNKFFWIAVIALFLGVIGYIAALLFKRQLTSHKSNIKLIDARNDESMSDYKETENVDKSKTIKPGSKK